MSHIVTRKTEVRDAAAVHAACRRLGVSEPVQGKARLFSGEAWHGCAAHRMPTGNLDIRRTSGTPRPGKAGAIPRASAQSGGRIPRDFREDRKGRGSDSCRGWRLRHILGPCGDGTLEDFLSAARCGSKS